METINGERKLPKIPEGPAPGQYNTNLAETIIMYRSIEHDFTHQEGRVPAAVNSDNGPGKYEEHRNFGHDSKD